MPRGRGRGGGGHKGQRRHFTNPDQLAVDKEKEERERKWREQRGEISSNDDSEEEIKKSSSESSSEDEEEESKGKAKGVQNLIEIENPNRIVKKDKKLTELRVDGENTPAPQLSRREREELDKQKARAHYLRMHAAGRTSEARADLARLAIIRKQREDALKKREEEAKAKKDKGC